MPIHIGKLSNNEPTFTASFIASVKYKNSLQTTGKVLIDTGATHTTVNKRIVRDLKIRPVGTGPSLVVGATEPTIESQFRLGIGVETLAGHTGMKLALISDALVYGDIELGIPSASAGSMLRTSFSEERSRIARVLSRTASSSGFPRRRRQAVRASRRWTPAA
jgi:hypothetical protein